ncbi:hypothetical protein FDECE_12768 [Fusarium decemcellulare]|nr:hypothetical protein FDECE_12768 [Fusarium decemcellulare]
MGVSLHPSQRRVSCEACRKQKSRCQRLNQNDPKCARCMMLDLECIGGQQRNVGRPRRAATAAASSDSTLNRPPLNTYSQPIPLGASQEAAFLPDRTFQIDWTSLMSPAIAQVQVFDKDADDSFSGAGATRSCMGMDAVGPISPPWDIGFGLAEAESMFAHNLESSIPTPSPFLLESPPSSVSADHSSCLTTINTTDMPRLETVDSIDASAAIFELSQMNLDLHKRVAAAEKSGTALEFNNVIHRQGALYIDNFTLAEFMLSTSQNLLLLLTRLLRTQQCRGLLMAPPATDAALSRLLSPPSQSQPLNLLSPSLTSCYFESSRPLSASLTLTITSVFTQLVSLYELILEFMTARVEHIATDPIAPIPGVTIDGVILENSYTQGALFAEAVVHMLERIECVLGIMSERGNSQEHLFSARQIKVLWSELDGRCTIIPGHANMKPATLREFFGKLASIFRHISLDS